MDRLSSAATEFAMSFQDAYLTLVVVAFATFALALAGACLWSRGARPSPARR